MLLYIDSESQRNRDADTLLKAIVLFVENECLKGYKKSHSIICTIRKKLIDFLINEGKENGITSIEEEFMKKEGRKYGREYNLKIERIIESVEQIQKIRNKKCKFY
jgi:hypothetical protein